MRTGIVGIVGMIGQCDECGDQWWWHATLCTLSPSPLHSQDDGDNPSPHDCLRSSSGHPCDHHRLLNIASLCAPGTFSNKCWGRNPQKPVLLLRRKEICSLFNIAMPGAVMISAAQVSPRSTHLEILQHCSMVLQPDKDNDNGWQMLQWFMSVW